MKQVLLLGIIVVTVLLDMKAQNVCGFDSLHQVRFQTDGLYKNRTEAFLSHWDKLVKTQYKTAGLPDTMPMVVPVVFHVIHNNGPENVPDSVILEQLDILNEDFGKIPGTPGDGNGADTRIQFCLAKIDPNGNPTTGITRTQSVCTDISRPGCENSSWGNGLIRWGNSSRQYLNFWIYKEFGHLGLGGQFMVMVKYNNIGRNNVNAGRVGTHEVGHALGLRHTFENGCTEEDCSKGGDYICDTPPASGPVWGCPTGINSCLNDSPDLSDQLENYMSYADGTCRNMFTAGQGEMMRSYLSFTSQFADYSYISSGANLENVGCYICTTPPCTPFADFKESKTLALVGDTIHFYDLSYSAPASWQWYFPGGTPATSTSQNPSVLYNSEGVYDVTLISTNAVGNDTLIRSSLIHVVTQQWSPMGQGLGCGWGAYDLVEYKGELYAGGYFNINKTDSTYGIAVWSDSAWTPLEKAFYDPVCGSAYGRGVYSMEVYKNELYLSGEKFDSAGNWLGAYVDKWDGNFFTTISDSMIVWDMIEFGNLLYIADISGNIAIWNGVNWLPVGKANGGLRTLEVYNSRLYIGGDFDTLDGMPISDIAVFDGSSWLPVSSGTSGPNTSPAIQNMAVYNGELYVVGNFTSVNGVNANYIARWNGSGWSSVGSGLGAPWPGPRPFKLKAWDGKLYVGGDFSTAGGVSANNIASWDGISWKPQGSGTDGTIQDIEIWNDQLYACGFFTSIKGGDTVNFVTKWGCPFLFVGYSQSNATVDLGSTGDVVFTNQSINTTNWFWDFGDGATDTSKNPVHAYTREGTYTVTLTASNDSCVSSASSKITVTWDCNPLDIDIQHVDSVDFTVTGDVQFYSQVYFADSIRWYFGDATTDTAENPLHTYSAPGVYSVQLTGYRDTCSNTRISVVVVFDPADIEEMSAEDIGLEIYPNPFTASATLRIINNAEQEIKNFEVRLYNLSGQLVRQQTDLSAGSVTLERGGLPGGMYFVVVANGEGVMAREKLMIR